MLRAIDLRCETDENPLAVPTRRPRFSWKMESDRSDVLQTQYRIEVAKDRAFAGLLWDSGPVDGGTSHLVAYEGLSLEECTRYYYRVKIRDSKAELSDWSETGWFECALSPESWRADFIRCDGADEGDPSQAVYFRKELALDGSPKQARLYATALGIYELWINGRRVGEDYFSPGWTNYRKRLAYQTYDVTSLLRPGRNVVGAVVGPGWYKGDLTWLKRRNFYGSESAVSLELRLRDEAGRATCLTTDTTWRTAAHGPIRYAELYHGEQYDARAEEPGWNAPGFDDRRWKTAALLSFDRGRLVPQEGPPVGKQEELAARELFTTPKGERVLDFGQNITGWVRFSVRGQGGQRVVLRHAEVLDAEGNFYTENLRSARAQVEYTLKGGATETFEPHFTFHGFRYVQLVEYPGRADPGDFTAVVLHSRMVPTLDFDCSDESLNRLHRNIRWGWKGNALDVPTDCAQRDERLGWTGDAQVFIGTAAYLFDVLTFFRKWLRDLASEQLPDGGVPFVVPDVLTSIASDEPMFGGGHSSTGWGDAAVICPWTLYLHYGDLGLLRMQYPSMKAWVEYIRAHAEQGLIWDTGFHFGDWVALDAEEGSYFGATPNELTATAFYAYSTELLARAAGSLGNTEDAAAYKSLHEAIVKAFRGRFISISGRLSARTQTAQILALVFGLVPGETRQTVVQDLVDLIEENGGHLTTGFLGTPFICRALAENGRIDVAYELLMRDDYPSWLYQVKRGATTVWEHWDGIKPDGSMWSPNMNSFNHYAYGAVGEWVYSTVGGISPDPSDPGCRTVVLSPQPGGGVVRATTRYRTPFGTVELAWRLDGERLSIDVKVPANSRGKLVLEGVSSADVRSDAEIKFGDKDGSAVARAGSGSWHVECTWRRASRSIG